MYQFSDILLAEHTATLTDLWRIVLALQKQLRHLRKSVNQ